MPEKPAKKKRKTIIKSAPKKTFSSIIEETSRPTKSLKEGIAIGATLIGPGKFAKGGKVIKEIAKKLTKKTASAASKTGKKAVAEGDKSFKALMKRVNPPLTKAEKAKAHKTKMSDPVLRKRRRQQRIKGSFK